jgi:lipoate-protein ligase A
MKIIFSPSTNPSFNLAAEQYFLAENEGDLALLYVDEPSVIIGTNQAVVNEVDMDFCIENGIRIFRRLSGGGAVFHDEGNLNYCFVSDRKDMPLSSDFLKPVIEVLASLGLPVTLGKRKDLWLEGFKVSGTASHVSKNRELHHGTLLYDTDLEMLQRVLSPSYPNLIAKASKSVSSPVKNLRTYLLEKNISAPEANDFFAIFSQKLLACFGLDALSSLTEEDMTRIEVIRAEKFIRREWNYRM